MPASGGDIRDKLWWYDRDDMISEVISDIGYPISDIRYPEGVVFRISDFGFRFVTRILPDKGGYSVLDFWRTLFSIFLKKLRTPLGTRRRSLSASQLSAVTVTRQDSESTDHIFLFGTESIPRVGANTVAFYLCGGDLRLQVSHHSGETGSHTQWPEQYLYPGLATSGCSGKTEKFYWTAIS